MISPGNRRWWALVALALSVLVVSLDLTVLNLALPTLAASLHASASDLQWFVDAYSVVLAAALLPAGMLGDRYGRKKILLISLVLFGAGSVACAYAPSAGALIAARAVLGLGAAAVLPLSLSVLPVMFPPQERPKAIAAIASVTFVSFPIGPILGGWLLDNFWWGSVFLINLPVIVLALAAVALLMPESRASARARVDLPGVLISSFGLLALTYGVIRAGEDGWSSPAAVGTIAAGLAALAAFAAWERRVSSRGEPLVDLALFRSASFTWGAILATLVSFALFGILFAMPQYFQEIRGLDALGAGVRLLPLIGGMMAGMIIGSRLPAARTNAKALVAPGFLVMAAALAAGAKTTVHSGSGFAAAWFAVTGAGLGIAMPTAMNAALGALSAERSGVGSAVLTAMRQVGATIGVAILGTVLSSVYRAHLNLAGLPAQVAVPVRRSVVGAMAVARQTGSAAIAADVRSAFVAAMDVMLWVCGGIALVAAAAALVFLPRQAPAAEQEASEVRTANEIGV
jgi:DHA2 family multidrug resistance protein-like MFS transporter